MGGQSRAQCCATNKILYCGQAASVWVVRRLARKAQHPTVSAMAEFKTLVARLDEAEQFLERASAPAPAASPYAPLDALDAAVSALEELTPRVGVFEKRALEKDPDKKVYGPKMAERVLAVAGRLADAAEAADELSDSLAPLRRQRSGERRAEQQREEEEAQAAAQAAVGRTRCG